jgi:hypothetical protein
LGSVLATTAPASAAGSASGSISLDAFTLTGDQFGTPTGRPTLARTEPFNLDGNRKGKNITVAEGESFTTSSIECKNKAPFNDVGLDFNPAFPGVQDPAPIRSVIRGTVTSVSPSGIRGTVEGTITTFLCENGKETDKIVIAFESEFRRTGKRMLELKLRPVTTTGGLELRNGTFSIVSGSGTGRFDSLTGSGTVTGQFTCLPRTLERNNARNCAELGAFSEAIFQLDGTFFDPAPGPGSTA